MLPCSVHRLKNQFELVPCDLKISFFFCAQWGGTIFLTLPIVLTSLVDCSKSKYNNTWMVARRTESGYVGVEMTDVSVALVVMS